MLQPHNHDDGRAAGRRASATPQSERTGAEGRAPSPEKRQQAARGGAARKPATGSSNRGARKAADGREDDGGRGRRRQAATGGDDAPAKEAKHGTTVGRPDPRPADPARTEEAATGGRRRTNGADGDGVDRRRATGADGGARTARTAGADGGRDDAPAEEAERRRWGFCCCCCCYDAPAAGRRRWTGAEAANLKTTAADPDGSGSIRVGAAAPLPRADQRRDGDDDELSRDGGGGRRRIPTGKTKWVHLLLLRLKPKREMDLGLETRGDAAPRSKIDAPRSSAAG